MRIARLVLASSIALLACSSKGSDAPLSGNDSGGDSGEDRMFGGARPVSVRVPDGYDPKKPAPLLLMLHGFSASGLSFELYLKMINIADKHGFFYVAPDGTEDSKHLRFWNATDACCDNDHTGVDDVKYLTDLVSEIRSVYAIDPKRIYILGHSNGGFMAHRLACEHSETFAAIASFAGAVWTDESKCIPSSPIGVLQIHGTADAEVKYAGATPSGGILGGYPGAEQTLATWAKKLGCADALTDTGTKIHVDADAKGSETSVLRHEGCPKNAAAELWKVDGGPHIFAFAPEGLETTWKFFEDHAKP